MSRHYTPEDLCLLRYEGVSIDLPPWIFGHDPDAAAAFAGWDQSAGEAHRRVRNAEGVEGRRPGLIKASRVGTAVNPGDSAAYRRLLNLAAFDKFGSRDGWELALAHHEWLVENYPDDLVATLTSFRALVLGANTSADLPEIAATLMGDWLAGESTPNASLHLVEVSAQLGNRYGLTRALLQREQPVALNDETPAFDSSLHLMEDINFGLGAYLEPLVTSLSPHVWGVTASRAGGILILSLGQPVSGRRTLSADALALSSRGGRPDNIGWDKDAPVDSFRETVNWWTCRLDLVFSHLTEPSNYEVDGQYDAPSALERLLNFEQICRSCQVISTVDDEHARRLALFHVLDSLGGIDRSLSWQKLTSPSANRTLLEAIRSRMPTGVQAALLPRAAASIEALEGLQDGFFLQTRLSPDGLTRPDKHGVETVVPLATAASEWLHVIRNSQHGYDKTPSDRDRALLAAHTGHIPSRLPDLAWLNLLRILTFPELLRRRPRGRSSALPGASTNP